MKVKCPNHYLFSQVHVIDHKKLQKQLKMFFFHLKNSLVFSEHLFKTRLYLLIPWFNLMCFTNSVPLMEKSTVEAPNMMLSFW